MIFEISCSIKKKKKSLQFSLFQNSNFWVFLIRKLQELFKKRSKSSICRQDWTNGRTSLHVLEEIYTAFISFSFPYLKFL